MEKIKIYLDMDGVLADFNGHTRALGIPYNEQWFEPRHLWTKETLEGERIKKAAMHSRGFWESIPRMPGARDLWAYSQAHGDVYVLTAKPRDTSPEIVSIEKRLWISNHMGYLPDENFICVVRSEKSKYATSFSPIYGSIGDPNLLVDDDHRNCSEWEKAGGTAFLYLDTETTIQQMEKVCQS